MDDKWIRLMVAGVFFSTCLGAACGDDSGGGGTHDAGTDGGGDGGGWADSNVPGNNPNEPDLPGDDLSGGTVVAAGSCDQ